VVDDNFIVTFTNSNVQIVPNPRNINFSSNDGV